MHMTRLRSLQSSYVDRLTDKGLLQLTALKHLTQLGLGWTSDCKLNKRFLDAVLAKCPRNGSGSAPCSFINSRVSAAWVGEQDMRP